jgi:hypothetical protein
MALAGVDHCVNFPGKTMKSRFFSPVMAFVKVRTARRPDAAGCAGFISSCASMASAATESLPMLSGAY